MKRIENMPCQNCNKERMIDSSKFSKDKYLARSPFCRSCKAKKISDKLSGTWFKKEHEPWNKGSSGLMPTPWNKGLRGMRVSPETEFKYTNGNGYRHLLSKGTLKQECVACGEENIKRLHIHHIDKNRKNNNLDNFAVLCRPCHLLLHGRKERVYVEGRRAV